MKGRGLYILFFLAGVAAFSYLIHQLGVSQLLTNIRMAGWSLPYVVLIWLAIYMLNTLAWKLALGAAGNEISFGELFMVTVSGFVMNYITPVVAVGGEPYKVKALASYFGLERSLSAVVLYRMVHLIGHMALLATGIVVAVIGLHLPSAVNGSLAFTLVGVVTVIIITLVGHRRGIFEPMMVFLGKWQLLRPAAQKLGKYSRHLVEMDSLVTSVYRTARKQFYASLAVEYVSRVLMGLEVYVILRGIGVETTVVAALFLYIIYSIIINLLFFIPLNLGAREGGLYLGMEALSLTPLLGVYLAVVMRLREFFWIMLGLLFVLVNIRRQRKTAGQSSAPAA